jgi:hypothetical protein
MGIPMRAVGLGKYAIDDAEIQHPTGLLRQCGFAQLPSSHAISLNRKGGADFTSDRRPR